VQSDQYKAELTSKLTTLILIFNCFRSKITHVFLWLFKAFDIIEEIKVNTGSAIIPLKYVVRRLIVDH